MWDTPTGWDNLIRGTKRVDVVASVWYDGEVLVDNLKVTGGMLTETYDGQQVRCGVDLTVQDDNGALVPMTPTDPLAPYGQQIMLRTVVSIPKVGIIESVPIGLYRIEPPDPEGGWVKYRNIKYLRRGGHVRLPLVDLLADVAGSDLVGLLQPLTGATVASEVARLARGVIPVDLDALPTTSLARRGVVYQTSRLDAMRDLLALDGMTVATGRDGSLSPRSVARAVLSSWSVTPEDGTWSDTQMRMTSDGIFNVYVATGETPSDGSAPVRGIAYEDTGPYRWSGPMRPRSFSYASPYLTTTQQAQVYAERMRDTRRASRQVEFAVTSVWNPAVDVLDTHDVTMIPGVDSSDRHKVRSLLIGRRMDLMGGSMELVYSAPREEVMPWASTP